MNAKRILIGELTAPHGVRGLMRLISHAEPADGIFKFKLSNDAGATVKVSQRGASKQSFIVAVDGVPDRTAADTMRGTKLYIDRAALPATKDKEFYIADLEGLAVRTADGAAIGTVKAVIDYGAGPTLDITRKGQENLLLPFKTAFVPKVDVAGGYIEINMPVEV
jgi:16S rRNA processing protein RimM